MLLKREVVGDLDELEVDVVRIQKRTRRVV